MTRLRSVTAIAIVPATVLRLLIDGWQGELVAGLTFLAGYVGAWKWIGLDESDRLVLRQLLQSRKKRRLQEDDAA